MRRVFALLMLVAPALVSCEADETYPCANDACVCPLGESCDIPCAAPPCHLDCAGDNPDCRGQCGNGECRCGSGSHCDFGCHSPPCHVHCEAGSTCTGTCANGTCRCDQGSVCALSCSAGPCHVDCAGDNAQCDGECANGTCRCGPNSRCEFVCTDGNCQAVCESGSSCVLRCPGGAAGAQGCSFSACAAGEPTVCPSGDAVACNAPCP